MISIKDGLLRISVRNLVEWLCREGDIDSRIGGVSDQTAMEAGSRAHRKIQKSMGPDYRAEVSLCIELPGEAYRIIIEGRADGIFEQEDAVFIDEIKGTYADIRYFSKAVPVHRAQAMCYAYMVMMEEDLEQIGIRMTYVNLDYDNVRYFEELLSREELTKWFLELSAELKKWADYVLENQKIRNQSIETISFPYPYREGQKELAAGVYRAIHQCKNLFIQAPTGVGKTLSTVFPSIKAIGQGDANKIFYLTAKTITRTAAEEAYAILREGGLHFKTVTITAKDKICTLCSKGVSSEDGEIQLYERPVCNPRSCPYAKGHLDRVNDAVYDLITHENVISREVIEAYAEKHRVCPFEFTLDITYWMDGIICDYNYAFDPHVRLKRFFAAGGSKEFIFLVDEAHNLVDRSREMFSASVYKDVILQLKHQVIAVDKRLANALERCNKNMLALRKQCPDTYRVLLEGEDAALAMNMGKLQEELSRFMEEYKDFEQMDLIADFFFEVMHYNAMYEMSMKNYIVYTEHVEGDFMLRLFCVNPSDNLKEILGTGRGGIFFSATLLPVNYYKELLSGNVEDYAIYAHSPFDHRKRLLMIGRDVTSRYTRRNEEEYLKIRKYILELAQARIGNYLIFFPSYQYLQALEELCLRKGDEERFEFLVQQKIMSESDKELFLSRFNESKTREKSLVAFCVMGGSFSEGIDLKYEQLIGTIIVGTGLPSLNTASQILRNYYDETLHSGYEYAYVYPGMNKVLQAAGRVIRTDEDCGVILLLDDRFLNTQYRKLFPREWLNYRTTTQAEAGQEILDFWTQIAYNDE